MAHLKIPMHLQYFQDFSKNHAIREYQSKLNIQ